MFSKKRGKNLKINKTARQQLPDDQNYPHKNLMDTFFRMSENIFYEHDLDDNYIFISPQIEKILGYTPEEAKAKWQKILSDNPKNNAGINAAHKIFEGEDSTVPYELEFIAKDGRNVWLEIREAPIKLNGQVTSIVGEAIDITERKKIEEEIQKLALIVEQTDNGIIITGRDEKTEWINEGFTKISGYNLEDVIGKEPSSYLAGAETNETELSKVLNAVINNLKTEAELLIYCKDGRTKWIQISLQPVFNNQNLFIKFIGFVLDISERKEAEIALKLSEEKFAKAFDNSPNAITISSIEDSTLIEINDYGLRALGYDKTEVIGKTALDLGIITADERKIILDAIEKDGFYKNLELPIKTKSGEIRIGAHFGQPIKIGDNNYLFQTINDITDRKRAEEELKYSEEKYSKTFLSSPDSISLTSMKEGIFVEINNGFEKIFGYSKEDTLGKTTFELGLWQDIKDRDNCINILKEQGGVRNYIANYNAKDGRSGTGEISMELVLIRDEEYLLTTVRDITERIKIERELKASEEKFSTAFYASPDANAISRMRDGKIIDVNPVFEKLFEYSREEAIGKTTAELNLYSNPMDRNKVFYLLNKDGVVRNLTVEFRAKSGKSGFLQISIDQINIADELCLITSIRDITDQINTQREIEDYQKKLRSLTSEITLAEERERRRIATNLHDHLSQSLAMSKIRLVEAEKQKSKEEVYTKIRDAKNFLDNAITKSRSITYELSPPVLYDLGFSAAIRWQLDEVTKEHKIKTELKDSADKITLNDEVRVLLFRAVVEIINNALKHAAASSLIVNISNDEELLFVTVTDNGKGFDLNEAEQNAAKNRSFGIFSLRERISFLKGAMEIDSKLNKGTSVKISIPYKNIDK